jgi:acyl transferase domain-containing protein/tryptophanase/acyl carrier protein
VGTIVNVSATAIPRDQLRDFAESYLKSLISSVADSLPSHVDTRAPFRELGIDSFHVLQILRALERDFGTLPKSLLFEYFNVGDLAAYFVTTHEKTLAAMCPANLRAGLPADRAPERPLPSVVHDEARTPSADGGDLDAAEPRPLRILEKDVHAQPALHELVRTLFARHKNEGGVSLGTRKIAPNLFIGGERRGYFNYGRSGNIVLVYAYTGPRDYLPALMAEMYRYCEARGLQLNGLTDEPLPEIAGKSFSATPFGALQRIVNLQDFHLDGRAMRRLRYQVSKFEKSGRSVTTEYRCGSDPQTDDRIAQIIDQWAAARTKVNPLVHDVRRDIVAGTLRPEHRLFLTYLDDVLQNVILITPMSAEENGYLMDSEFYPPDMPQGGLEFAIVEIIKVLVAEGCGVLSLGGTYGCKLAECGSADPEIDSVLDDLRAQSIFNDAGNLQFKNKFRPENKTIFLCRPVGSGSPGNVVDVIMMIADPEAMQTPDIDDGGLDFARREMSLPADGRHPVRTDSPEATHSPTARAAGEAPDRSLYLSQFGFNPLNIPRAHVDFELATDSWALLDMPVIQAETEHLHLRLQEAVSVDESVRTIFPFAYHVVTASGQAAERLFFKAWPTKGVVLQNLLFPSTLFHQIDNGFTVREVPHPAVFQFDSDEPYKSNTDWDRFQAELTRDPAAVAFACIELNDNAAGGYPVSMGHLGKVRTLLSEHALPLVIDGTRVLENARFLVDHAEEAAGKSVWAVARELLGCADAVIASLTKDFCVPKGGIVATNDVTLFRTMQRLLEEEGGGIDTLERRMIALALRNHAQIDARVRRRIDHVRRIWTGLKECGVPVVQPAGGHCVLIDVMRMPEFSRFKHPVASFLAWLYASTGIRAAAHSAGMQRGTALNELVRLAVPVGLTEHQIDTITHRLVHAFAERVNVPELIRESGAPQPPDGLHATYSLVRRHRVSTPPSASAPSLAAAMNGRTASEPERTWTAPAGHASDIAVIGMAGRYPKAKNLAELWDNLAGGRHCVEEIPADRYAWRLQHGSAARYRGGFIEDVDRFDSLFFNISPKEAEMLDPQERLFLEVSWEALEDAGYYPEALAGGDSPRNVGVFVGAVWTTYQLLGVEEKHAGNRIVPNSFLWSIANRVSHCFNLCGPSLTVDTACSSSLTALYLACEALYTGQCSAAIVGGVNLDLHQVKWDINHAGGALSPDGVCRSFGKGANGYVAGEGVGALLLKPLVHAERDRDHIYGVVKSAVVNHGGRTGGYTVPNPRAQTDVVASALRRANVDARTIGYIEAHGTGTALGDPIEISALSRAFAANGTDPPTCAIGSVKTNIGHLEAAAGIVGVTKVLLQMQHRKIAPSLHSAELNELIDFASSPFYVAQQLEDWLPKAIDGVELPLRAGISSFGAGGSNAHVIVEQYAPRQRSRGDDVQPRELIVPLSAASDEQLREVAIRLATFVRDNVTDLNDVAYTLQVGRRPLDHRLAVVATTRDDLLEKLGRFIDGQKADGVTVGHVKHAAAITQLLNRQEREEFVRLLSRNGDVHKIATLWTEGLLEDWNGHQPEAAGRRVPLPTYPFADRRHWAFERSTARPVVRVAAGLHPLIDSNESTFERQIFKKTFSERDAVIDDHHVSDLPTLPGVAYLEMARQAGELAAGRKVQKIRNIVWVSPITVPPGTSSDVFIELKPNGAAVRFEVFSHDEAGNKVLHSQGTLLYAAQEDLDAAPEYVDLDSIRARCAHAIDGAGAYTLFKSLGLTLGPSFQVLGPVQRNADETLGVLRVPRHREADLQRMALYPSLVDGAMQAGMAAQLHDKAGEMFVPLSIGEVEILHPLGPRCISYVTNAGARKQGGDGTRTVKSNVLILDENGKVLVRIRESTGVPLRELHGRSEDDGFRRLYYVYDWEHAPLSDETPLHDVPRSILLFAPEQWEGRYRERLRQAGADRVVVVRPGESFEDLADQGYRINPAGRDDFTRLFDSLIERQHEIESVCFAWPCDLPDPRDESGLQQALARGVYALLFVCQCLVRHKLEGKVQLLYVYSGAAGTTQPHHEAVGGFFKALQLEFPKLACKALETPRGRLEDVLDAVTSELRVRRPGVPAVRYDGHGRHIKRLRALDLEAEHTPRPERAPIRDAGVYLITGGAGGLGRTFAEYLAREHKARLVLTGRSALSIEDDRRFQTLREARADVLYIAADVSRREDLETVIQRTKDRFGRIDGIVHAAGVTRDSLLRDKTAEEMSAVFASKVFGTFHLDELTKDDDLDFFVTFSSLAALTGNAGQCDYSFANHFMDSFAAGRERLRHAGARSGKTLSLNWSIWADGGMKLDEQTARYFERTMGIRPLSTVAGLDAFVEGLASERCQLAVLEGHQNKVELAWGLRQKPTPPPAPTTQAATSVAAGADRDLLALLQNDLSQIVMRLLKLEASDAPPDKILLELGFDSIGLTTFANAINDKYGLDLTPVLFFDYPTIGQIAAHLATERGDEIRRCYGRVAPAPAPAATSVAAPQPMPQTVAGIAKGWNPADLDRGAKAAAHGGVRSPERRFVDQPIAVVGMSGVMPQSEDLEEFWENLEQGRDLVTVIPPDRWRWEDYYGDPLKEVNKSNSKWGAFMKEVDTFDPLFFGISPREAQMMDPQQRIFLQQVWKAIEDSGQKVSDLSGTRTGLFVGVATNDYVELMTRAQIVLDGYSASGNSHSVLANRVSFLLNLRGPSAPIDTACSSSLVALHRAIESIHTGSCDMAIVGGVLVMLTPAAHISFGMAGMLSGDGKCKTFDKRANGYVRGEGCGAIFLKTLAAAEADGNHIYAVIKATAENHGGRVTTLTAPNSAAQTELLIEAYEKAQIDPATVGYIECHGTGTSLGDPIEIQSMSKAFAELYKRHNRSPAVVPHCGLSSVKTNIGHLETAAGIAGVLKVLLALKHKKIPANIHLEEVNPYINLTGTPFRIVDTLAPWEAPTDARGVPAPRRAGVSSFGFGGANAHVVLEEYVPRREAMAASREPQLFVLSAKNEDRLNAYVVAMHAYLEKHDVALADLAHTLHVGRDEMRERLAMVVSSVEDLRGKLAQIVDGRGDPPDTWRNSVKNKATAVQANGDGRTIRELIERKELAKLAELWVSGASIDWQLLHHSGTGRRISIPTYPFAKERYWLPVADGRPVADHRPRAAAPPARLHPLVHRNTSTLAEQRFSSRFSGDEFFLADHVVETQKVLPGVAYLEMARAAGDFSRTASARLIRHLTWERPLVVDEHGVEVEVSLAPVKDDVKFVVRTAGEKPVVHCTGTLAYVSETRAPEALDIAAIRARCSDLVVSGTELYEFLSSAGLTLGKSFQIVQDIYATRTESLAILRLPDHLRSEAGEFWLHPALMDGALHTAVGLMKKNDLAVQMRLPYSVGEVEIFEPLDDLYYGYATWSVDDGSVDGKHTRGNFHLLDKNGNILIRVKDFVSRPLLHPVPRLTRRLGDERPAPVKRRELEPAVLRSFAPVWNVVRGAGAQEATPESTRLLLVGGDQAGLNWVRTHYPNAELLPTVWSQGIAAIEEALAARTFDQLLWIAPDVDRNGGQGASPERILDVQEDGVLTVFRTIKALLHRGYGNKRLQWTIVLGRTHRVTNSDAIQPTHAGVVGLVGSLAKEYPQWNLRLLDLDSLASVSARECLSRPWDGQGNVLAHRRGEWFRQELAVVPAVPRVTPAYRQGGVYVVIGGAGGIGEVWSRFMIENHQANLVWIGRRELNGEIEEKIRAMARLGPAPLYLSADATNAEALDVARTRILDVHPAIHGIVHSAIVLRDQSLSRMDEATFRASLSAKVDVSVNIERVFAADPLDFMLFFSSIISFVKSPGQANYAAGCTFKDSFAQMLQQRWPYPVKIMNWGYWGSIGAVAAESYNRTMERLGIGSIEPLEGMAALQLLLGSDLRQLAVIKTIRSAALKSLNLSETLTYHPRKFSTPSRQTQRAQPAPAFGTPQPSTEAAVALL